MKTAPVSIRWFDALAVIATAVIGLVPFYAVLTVWPASALGHYTAIRLWPEYLLVILSLGAVAVVAKNRLIREELAGSTLVRLIGLYVLVQLVWGVVALAHHAVSAKALGYAWVVNLRFLVFFLAVWVVARRVPRLARTWPRLLLWPAIVVVAIALLQALVLPYDFMKHLGYNANTIYPYETINHNLSYIRVMSTLRGANPLGAYLVVVLASVAALLAKRSGRRLWLIVLGLAALATLFFSFSRSAWIGAALSLALVAWLGVGQRARRWLLAAGAGAVIILGAVFIIYHSNAGFENAIYHTSDNSTIKTTSNENHASALRSGLDNLALEPLGRGPGTAGPASVYNRGHAPRIAENYFVQVGQETGWLGLVIFIIINIYLAMELVQRRTSALALSLLAALIGVSFVNLLSHAWADPTLAYVFWGLAGLAMAMRRARQPMLAPQKPPKSKPKLQ